MPKEDVRLKVAEVTEARCARSISNLYRVYTVFNIGGNDFRLITEIFYRDQTVLLRDVLTYAEYDAGNWKK